MTKKLVPGSDAISANSDGSVSVGKIIHRAQPLLGTPVAGAMEFSDGRWYLTGTAIQRVIDRTGGVIVATTTVASTSDETTLYTTTLSANAMKAGRIYKLHCDGIIANGGPTDDITFNVYLGADLIGTCIPAIGSIALAKPWHVDFNITIRTTGDPGTAASHGHAMINTVDSVFESLEAPHTNLANAVSLKVQWTASKAANTISIYQGYLEFKN